MFLIYIVIFPINWILLTLVLHITLSCIIILHLHEFLYVIFADFFLKIYFLFSCCISMNFRATKTILALKWSSRWALSNSINGTFILNIPWKFNLEAKIAFFHFFSYISGTKQPRDQGPGIDPGHAITHPYQFSSNRLKKVPSTMGFRVFAFFHDFFTFFPNFESSITF